MTAPLSSPERVIGGYRLGDHIGEGGQGRVFRATRIADGLEVAFKLYELPVNEVMQSRVRRRHQRECTALRNVSSPEIVKVVDAGEYHEPTIATAGWLWTAFELVEGPHLKHMMSLKPVDVQKIFSTLSALAQGLQLVHSAKVVHRDIKPDNIILRKRRWDEPVLVDFGYARPLDASRLTRTGVQVGSLAYMAPETKRGLEPTPLADQWSLARLTAELLLWNRGEDFDELPDVGVRDEIVERFVGCPATVEVLERALDPDPASRFADVVEFTKDLEGALVSDGLLERDEEPVRFSGQPWDKRRSLRSYLESIGFTDIRVGASLWVYAGKNEFAPVQKYLATKGIYFNWAANGTRKRPRPGWWTKDAK